MAGGGCFFVSLASAKKYILVRNGEIPMSVILGINAFHADSAACLLIDGKLMSAIAEERLGDRMKHSPLFPENAIRRILKETGLRLKDVTHVAIARAPKANYCQKAAYVLRHPVSGGFAALEHFRRRSATLDMRHWLVEVCDIDPEQASFQTVEVEHHLAHLASSYYLSPFDSLTAGFSYDASGDFLSGMAAKCEGTKINIIDKIYLPHSLGFFYTAICQLIGFTDFGEEYKVMGLASYGENKYADEMQKLLSWGDSYWYRLNTRYFGMHDGGVSGGLDENGRIIMRALYRDSLVDLLGKARERRSQPISQREKDMAKSCQVRFEQVAIYCMMKLHSRVKSDQLVLAGGCALNGVANVRILRDTPFTKSYIQSAASDDGTCLGAAYYCYHNVVGGTERFHMNHAYWGPDYSEKELQSAARSTRFPTISYGDKELLEHVADLIAEGKVVAWYQGRSEWGPRALGNRSILANPSIPNMKDVINAKIKKRESFRPFAPTVLEEYVDTYFEQNIRSPFMMHVVKIKPEWRDKLPAITHVDGTGRLQSIERSSNPRYYDLIKRFSEKTGIAVVLNTSFNENEPIIDTPTQAVDCFLRTDMDVLVLGNNVIEKTI